MKKKPVRKIVKKSVSRHSGLKRRKLSRGALGAGMAYAILGLLVVLGAGTTMIGNITPSGKNEGQPVILLTDAPDGTKDNLQLETFPGVTITPTITPTVPPPPNVPNPSGGTQSGSGGSRGGGGGGGGRGGGGGGGSCFVKGTPVLMANGTHKNIENVKIGDQVIGFDGKKKVTETVLELESPVRDHIVTVTFSDGSKLQMTDEHPLYTDSGWKSVSPDNTALENPQLAVGKLKNGDKVLNSHGQYVAITSMVYKTGQVQTYNLKSVSGHNNYYAGGKLAHNKGSKPSRGGGGGGGGGSCFVKGTKVLMADGTRKNIEDVKAGEKVMGYNGKGQVAETVVEVESPVRDHYYDVRLSDGTVLGMTDEHPLLTAEGWKSIVPAHTAEENAELAVKPLRVGDKVLKSTGKYVTIDSMTYKPGNVKTYNLKKVSGYNTFFANDVVAHNKGGGGGGNSGGGGGGGSGGL